MKNLILFLDRVINKTLKGSYIHAGAVIGASSLVKGEIPSFGAAVGIQQQ